MIGKIPGYQVIDLVLNYKTGKFKVETGINNLGNEIYFTEGQLDIQGLNYTFTSEKLLLDPSISIINNI